MRKQLLQKCLNGTLIILFAAATIQLPAQTSHAYNLAELLNKGRIITSTFSNTSVLEGNKAGAISSVNSVWLPDIDFTEGTIDLDLRGKNVFLKSFLGIIFHAADTLNTDLVIFRPFNFHHADTTRQHWSVAYMTTAHPWFRLRKEHPLTYENKMPADVGSEDWFHATIEIKERMIRIYINHAAIPVLELPLLNERRNGKFGLSSDGLASDFANLVITPYTPKKEHTQTVFTDEQQIQGTRLLSNNKVSDGLFELDLKGNDSFGKSFLGLAFHAKDTSHMEILYFRPFNFQTTDSLRKLHAIQYMSIPDYPWNRLRTDSPEWYEAPVLNAPGGNDWFHARIRLQQGWVTVYLGDANEPSLQVRAPKNFGPGKFGLWTDPSVNPGYFRNLKLTTTK